jgi:hypothetical protein
MLKSQERFTERHRITFYKTLTFSITAVKMRSFVPFLQNLRY